jgi:hypothetical protein
MAGARGGLDGVSGPLRLPIAVAIVVPGAARKAALYSRFVPHWP